MERACTTSLNAFRKLNHPVKEYLALAMHAHVCIHLCASQRSAGVPTVWLNLLAYMARTKRRLSSLKVAVIGGAAAARSLIDALEKT
eukprot:1145819-Pelagomonas_calceolata.AAC.5